MACSRFNWSEEEQWELRLRLREMEKACVCSGLLRGAMASVGRRGRCGRGDATGRCGALKRRTTTGKRQASSSQAKRREDSSRRWRAPSGWSSPVGEVHLAKKNCRTENPLKC